MLDLTKFAPHLVRDAHAIWRASSQQPVSYPEDGSQRNLTIEQDSFWYQHRTACILAAMRLFPPSTPVFDIGGGNGLVCRALQQAGLESVLVEPGTLAALAALQSGVTHVVCSTLEDARFRIGTLPAVGLFDVLEHIQHPRPFLQNIASVLRVGGLLYLTVPAYNVLWSSEDDYAAHWRRYTLHSLVDELASAGFTIEYQTYIFAWLPLPIFVLRTLPFRLGLRSQGGTQRYQEENLLPDNFLGRMLNTMLDWEHRWLAGGRRVLFGGSCLAIARKQ